MGVKTALFEQERSISEACTCDFQGDTAGSWRSLFSFQSLNDLTINASFMEVAFDDLAAKRESAWMNGVETVLFRQEKNT